MDSFEINKIVAAILLVALLIIGISKISNLIFYVDKPEKPGYEIKVEQVSALPKTDEKKAVDKIDIAALMALGVVASGEKIFK